MSGRHEERFLAARSDSIRGAIRQGWREEVHHPPYRSTDSPVAIALQPEGTRALSQLQRRLSNQCLRLRMPIWERLMTPPPSGCRPSKDLRHKKQVETADKKDSRVFCILAAHTHTFIRVALLLTWTWKRQRWKERRDSKKWNCFKEFRRISQGLAS